MGGSTLVALRSEVGSTEDSPVVRVVEGHHHAGNAAVVRAALGAAEYVKHEDLVPLAQPHYVWPIGA